MLLTFLRPLLCAALIYMPFVLLSQTGSKNLPGDEKKAMELFSRHNYYGALQEFAKLLPQDPLSVDYNYFLGVCYLNTCSDWKKAVTHLEFAAERNYFNSDIWYELGRAYLLNNNIEKAESAFRKYIVVTGGKDKFYIPVHRQLEMVGNARDLITHPLNVTYINPGKQINSPWPDYNPFISKEASILAFTSKRPENTGKIPGNDGFFTPDIYLSEKNAGSWAKAKNAGATVNSFMDDELTSLSSDGKTLFICSEIQQENYKLFYSKRKGKSYQKQSPFSSNVNDNKQLSAVSISDDGSTLFLSCEREGGYGNKDLYLSRLLPNGEWSDLINLGPVINTQYDEDYPVLSTDGKTLRFCSIGHNSMGGYDIFESKGDYKTNHWDKPQNIGFPINTTADNTTISFSENGRIAWLSTFREGGQGDLDIWQVIFNDIPAYFRILDVEFLGKDSINVFEKAKCKGIMNHTFWNKADVRVFNASTGILEGIYKPDRNSARYNIALRPGNYKLVFKSEDKIRYSGEIKVQEADKEGEITIMKILISE